MNTDPQPTPTKTLEQKLLVIILDVVVLAELTLGMYLASKTPDSFTPTFFKIFFGMLVPTLVAFWIVNRSLRRSARRQTA